MNLPPGVHTHAGHLFLLAKLNTPSDGRDAAVRALKAIAVGAAFQAWLARAESDLLLVMDCDNRFLLIDLWDAIRARAIDKEGAVLHSLQEGLNRGDGRDHTGYFDGISNLRQKIATDPAY